MKMPCWSVASQDGEVIDQHFGHAKRFQIYALSTDEGGPWSESGMSPATARGAASVMSQSSRPA